MFLAVEMEVMVAATTHSDDKECLCSAWGAILDGMLPSGSSVSG